jgi:hypothetical protein
MPASMTFHCSAATRKREKKIISAHFDGSPNNRRRSLTIEKSFSAVYCCKMLSEKKIIMIAATK